jgi:hypothetical protein
MMARRKPRPHEDRGLERRRPSRDPLPLILVVCEGKVTEPQYLEGFRIAHGASTIRVHIRSPGGEPRALVPSAADLAAEAEDRARREGDDNLRYDEVWCVLDVDEHARLEEARALARANHISLAVSNPCFELWILLHFADHGAHVERKRASSLLQKHLPGYGKHVRFESVEPGYAQAVARATALDQRHERAGTEGANPSTGVYRLTERIRQLGKAVRR